MKTFLILLLTLCHWSNNEDPNKSYVTIQVYYESKCPDSRGFVLKQLVPATQKLQEYISVNLIPFGKAHSINNGYAGFQCQHGPTECRGNIVQDCALEFLKFRPDTERVNYVACEMKSYAAANGDLQCVEKANLPVDKVLECTQSKQGLELQLDSEYLTKLINPKFVPTVTFNGVFNQQMQNRALKDLTGTICSLIRDAPPCYQHYNNVALNYVLM